MKKKQNEKIKKHGIDDDDIEIVVMNPECIPIAQERLFEFF